jgi:nicotinamide-nucleotide amidase
MLPQATLDQAAALLAALRAEGRRLVTAESCTGGLIAAALTHVAGSSDVFERGFVTYSNESKAEALGVDPALIARHGAVSAEVAAAMAAGALAHARADLSVSVTGIAGPGGGSPEKPVGLVWFGVAERGFAPRTVKMIFPGDRPTIRAAAVSFGLFLCTTPKS